MLRRGMNPDAFHFYLDTFKNGMPPHGGFAIGLERITACFLGIANVKECSMFPRDHFATITDIYVPSLSGVDRTPLDALSTYAYSPF